MKVGVIGCGRWGTFLACYVSQRGYDTWLYGRANSARLSQLVINRSNGMIDLPEELHLTSDLTALLDASILIISVGAQSLRTVLRELQAHQVKDRIIVLCMKGLEIDTGKRLSVIAEEELDHTNRIAVWLGPGHVQEFAKGIPNCMVIDSKEEALKQQLVEYLASDTIRFYYGTDLIGNEIGAASKNVIGIAAGMLDGLGLSSLKGALMARGPWEISRLIQKLGGNALSAYGLCHLGDYEATVFSKYSHNRQFGENWVTHQAFDQLAEGYYTVLALRKLEEQQQIELPISDAVYQVLYAKADPQETLSGLFMRSIKKEFWQ